MRADEKGTVRSRYKRATSGRPYGFLVAFVSEEHEGGACPAPTELLRSPYPGVQGPQPLVGEGVRDS